MNRVSIGISSNDTFDADMESLWVGETITYCSPMYVAGDPRGKLCAIITEIKSLPAEFPIRLSNDELIPGSCLIRRKLDRSGIPIRLPDGRWRKLCTYKTYPGKMQVQSVETQFGKAVKQGITSSYEEVRREIQNNREYLSSRSSDNDFEMRNAVCNQKSLKTSKISSAISNKKSQRKKRVITPASQPRITVFLQQPDMGTRSQELKDLRSKHFIPPSSDSEENATVNELRWSVQRQFLIPSSKSTKNNDLTSDRINTFEETDAEQWFMDRMQKNEHKQNL